MLFVSKEITLKKSRATGNQIGDRIDLSSVFDGLIESGVDELAGAIYEEMSVIKGKSQEVVPVGETGLLRASADAVGVNLVRNGSRGQVVIGYGGAASAYTFIQHQTPPPGEGKGDETTFSHAPGRTWKYLERPVLEAIDGMEGRIAARIRARMAAR